MVTIQDIQEAYERIKNDVNRTSVLTSRTINQITGCSVFFKCEQFQRIGAFKFRGAFNTISQLSPEEKERGILTHSSGNHAQAVALASSILGIKATIVMPENSPKVKVDATRGYGADIVFCESTPEGRVKAADKLMTEHGYVLIHPYNNERIIAGAGTAALELIDEVGELDVVMAPVGGGGLMSGTSIATKALCPNARVIAVEPANADDAYRSFHSGEIHPSINPKTIADGLRTQLLPLTFEAIRENVDEIVLVSENEIIEAMKLLWERMKLVVEPSGAVSLAGLLKISKDFDSKRMGVIISGGNIDLKEFFETIEKQIEE